MYYTWKNIKKWYKNRKFKISTPTCNGKFDLPDESYYHSSMIIYINAIENMNTFKIKTGYYLELLTLETMKLLACIE